MEVFVTALTVLILQLINLIHGNLAPYVKERDAIIEAEELIMTGGRIHLSSKEAKANDLFMKYKSAELEQGFRNSEINPAGMHFFKAKKLIERSKVFKFLQQMPKGALLHTHNTASVSSEWVVRNISYTPGLLRCTDENGVSVLSFRRSQRLHECNTQYVLVHEERHQSKSPEAYDSSFEKLINLYTATPEVEYSSIGPVWIKFQNMFKTLTDALYYLPVFRAYHRRMLEEFYEDNIMYLEMRTSFGELYDMSGRLYPPERTVRELLNIIEQFRREHPKFLGVKVITATHRNKEVQDVRKYFESFLHLHALYPNFVVGFDLVGQEDVGKPLYDFIGSLTDLPRTARYFFHAGETNWYGSPTDFNLIDAILMNTTRIGHGYALMKHPILWNTVKKRDIAVEVSPISNQVLHLVLDMRNHPGGFFMSQDIPMVICNDDPGFWGSKALSYDYYYVIMSMASNHIGLRALKQLVWNSIRYSVMHPTTRKVAYKNLERDWEHFIDNVLQGLV